MIGIIILVVLVAPLIVFGLMVLHRHMKYPEKSLFYAFVNTLLYPVRLLKLGPYKYGKPSVENGLKYAVRKTKLSDFNGTEFIDNYKAVYDSDFYKIHKYSNIGMYIAGLEINLTFARRLMLVDYFKRFPQISSVPVRSPVFLTGLPRTGTTFMQRLLSLDPNARSPLLWELLQPTPGVPLTASREEFEKDRSKRLRKMKALLKTRQDLGDHALAHIHEIGAELPEECLIALTDELPVHLSCLYADYMNAEYFLEKTKGEPVVKAYKWYKQVLQLLSYQVAEETDPKRWLLKCPIHIFYFKELAKAFPDAKVVWTHRHPVSAVPSMCSLIKAVHQIYYEKESRDDAQLGREISKVSAMALEQGPKDIKEAGLDCSHVNYEDLVSNPLQTVKNIYKQFGWIVTEEYERNILEYLEKNSAEREELKQQKSKDPSSLHSYTPEEFSLTADDLTAGTFGEYVKKFNLQMSKG